MQQTDIRILELMASKICHDLISPVGAVANGVEILEELGPDAGEDVTGLISFSAAQAGAKLKAMRLAYGLGGADSSIKPEDVHKTFGEFIDGDKRITQNWDPYSPLGPAENPTGFAKILICALLLVSEALPKGGEISIEKGGENITLVNASGENAGFREGFRDALEQKMNTDIITPKHTHAFLTGLLSVRYGYKITIESENNTTIVLKIVSPVV